MPCYIYTRVSHPKSAKSGIGLDIQREACIAYYDKIKKDTYPSLAFGREYSDPAQSAGKPLRLRPGGGEMNFALERGDHVIFYRIDRAFRDMRDLTECVAIWEERGIVIHFTNLGGVDLTTAMGKLFLHVFGAVAEMERSMASERSLATMEYLKDHGRPRNRFAKYGHRIIGPTGKRRQVPLTAAMMADFRAVPREIVDLKLNHSMGWRAISDHIEAKIAAFEGRRVRMLSSPDRKFKPITVERLYREETALQAKEAVVLADAAVNPVTNENE